MFAAAKRSYKADVSPPTMQTPRAGTVEGYVSGIEARVSKTKPSVWWRLGWLITGGLLAVLALRFVWHDGLWPLLIFNAYAWLLFAPIWLVLPFAIWKKKHRMAIAAGVCACWHLFNVVPPVVSADPPPAANERRLRVVNANLLTSNRRPETLLDELLAADADVLILQEVSPVWVHFMEQRVFPEYPHRILESRGDAFGAAILSRVEAIESDLQVVDGLPWPRMVIPFGVGSVEILCVHTLPPRTSAYVEGHLRQLDAVADWALADERTRIVAGDFNSTVWSRFHGRMEERFDDAWNLAGDGFGFTWPNGLFNLPPARLDHVYVSRDLTVTEIEVGRGVGSDHRPLILTIAER